MKPVMKLLAGSLLAPLLVACGGDGKPDTDLRVLHASADAPAVDVRADSDTVLTALAFGTASPYDSVKEGEYRLRVDGIVPGGTATVIDTTADLDGQSKYTVLAVGQVGDSSIEPLVVSVPDESVGNADVRAQIVHAAAGAPAVDVYVTGPSDPLSGAMPLGSVDFKESLGPVTVPGGDYRIRVTGQGTTNVVFDSGTVTLPGGSDFLIAAIDNTGPSTASAPIRLVVADGSGSFQILDKDSVAAVRAGHFSPDAGTVDVFADNAATPLFDNANFPNVTAFANVPPATYAIDVTPDGTSTPAIDDAPLSVAAGERYTAFAVGLAAGTPALDLIASEDDLRSIATEAKLRVVHAASQAPNVDVYVTDQSTMAADLGSRTPVLTDVPFKAISDFLSVAGGDYRVFVTATGTTTVAIGPVDLTLDNGGVYTVVARDLDTGVPTFTAELIDDTP